MRFVDQPAARESTIPYINDHYLADEQKLVRELSAAADPGDEARSKIQETAARLVRAVRKNTATDAIRKMDREDQIVPRNYSAILGLLISVFVVVFLAALLNSGGG